MKMNDQLTLKRWVSESKPFSIMPHLSRRISSLTEYYRLKREYDRTVALATTQNRQNLAIRAVALEFVLTWEMYDPRFILYSSLLDRHPNLKKNDKYIISSLTIANKFCSELSNRTIFEGLPIEGKANVITRRIQKIISERKVGKFGLRFSNSFGMDLVGTQIAEDNLYIGTTELTEKHYRNVMGYSRLNNERGENYPVTGINISAAKSFCKKLSLNKIEQAYGIVYRLPTEKEWVLFAGKEGKDKISANINKINPGPVEVGSYKPNDYGLYDLRGNVREWCNDSKGNLITNLIGKNNIVIPKSMIEVSDILLTDNRRLKGKLISYHRPVFNFEITYQNGVMDMLEISRSLLSLTTRKKWLSKIEMSKKLMVISTMDIAQHYDILPTHTIEFSDKKHATCTFFGIHKKGKANNIDYEIKLRKNDSAVTKTYPCGDLSRESIESIVNHIYRSKYYVTKGGGWIDRPEECNANSRIVRASNDAKYIGFRVVCELTQSVGKSKKNSKKSRKTRRGNRRRKSRNLDSGSG